jgi:hypothetical protein
VSAVIGKPEEAVAAIAAPETSSEIRGRARTLSVRSLVDAALEEAEPTLPQLTRIQRNYQPALLTTVDPVSVEKALTALVVAAAESLEAGVRASRSFFPALDVETDTEDGVRIRISHNAAIELREHARQGCMGAAVHPVTRARRLLRSAGGELWTEPGSPSGMTFLIRFPTPGRR